MSAADGYNWAEAALPIAPPRDDRTAGARRAPREPVLRSYLTNRVCVDTEDGRFWLEPCDVIPAGSALPKAIADLLPFTITSAWNPAGRPTTLEENRGLDRRFQQSFDRDVAPVPAVAVARDGTWFESSWLVAGGSISEAQDLLQRTQQAAAIHLTASEWIVVEADRDDGVPWRHTTWRVVADLGACPVRRFGARAGLCKMHGGPWVSASIEAAGVWTVHRQVAIELLSCPVCQNGAEPVLGPTANSRVSLGQGPIHLNTVLLGSRYGGYAYGSPIGTTPNSGRKGDQQ